MNENITLLKNPLSDNALAMLESWMEMAKRGEIVSVGLIGLGNNGEWRTAFSASPNGLMDAAMLMELAIRRLGFVQEGK